MKELDLTQVVMEQQIVAFICWGVVGRQSRWPRSSYSSFRGHRRH